MHVSTTNFEFAHGRKPRGYGLWAFYFDNWPEPYWFTGKYSDAKKSAIALAVSKGFHLIAVGS